MEILSAWAAVEKLSRRSGVDSIASNPGRPSGARVLAAHGLR